MRKKKRLFSGLFIALVLGACGAKDNSNVLSGDLYFGIIRIGSYYNVPDSTIKKFESSIDTIHFETAEADDKEFLMIYKTLKREGLIYKPFVDLLIQKDSTAKLYLDSTDYDQIKIYKRQQLVGKHKKVRISATVREIRKGFYYCLKLKEVELVDGETQPREGKLRLENYN